MAPINARPATSKTAALILAVGEIAPKLRARLKASLGSASCLEERVTVGFCKDCVGSVSSALESKIKASLTTSLTLMATSICWPV